MRDDVFELAEPEIRVDRDDRDPERVEREPQLDEDRSVLKQQPDPMALAIAPFCERSLPRVHPREHGGIADLAGRDAVIRGGLRQHVEKCRWTEPQRGVAKA